MYNFICIYLNVYILYFLYLFICIYMFSSEKVYGLIFMICTGVQKLLAAPVWSILTFLFFIFFLGWCWLQQIHIDVSLHAVLQGSQDYVTVRHNNNQIRTEFCAW